MNKPRSAQLGRFGVLTLAVLAGCAEAPTHPRAHEPAIEKFVGKGYLSAEQFSIKTTPMTWQLAGRDVDFLLSVPVRPGRYPLIIYLPGLGEGRTAGDGWRNTWAQAGYAVLSVQLLSEDRQVWQSRAARSGDFVPLVRERYATGTMAERQAALYGLVAELRQRAADPALVNVDLSRIALAGYDIGAYTAMVAAGENLRNSAASTPADPWVAVIALSPHADFSGPAFEGRYSAIKVPVLSVTGQGDTDSYGFVTSAAVRTAPYQYMPPGGKYLLTLADTSHELLGGGSPSQVPESGAARPTRASYRPDTNEGGHRRARGEPTGGGEGGRTAGNRSPVDGWEFTQSAIRAVTTAFLDAQIKDDAFAREWLGRDARRWLRETASLTVK